MRGGPTPEVGGSHINNLGADSQNFSCLCVVTGQQSAPTPRLVFHLHTAPDVAIWMKAFINIINVYEFALSSS
jgi:hypothetical protein